jgi:maltose O-acetyltransferase
MTSEKEKMVSGEPYDAWDKELYTDRINCRKILQKLNNSIPDTLEWRTAIDSLLPSSSGAFLEPPFRCDYGYNLKVGKHFYANFNCVVLDGNIVKVGDNVMFGPNVQIYTAGHPLDAKSRVEDLIEFAHPITIEDNVWVGGGVIVLPNVTIGENSVIGAGSVVTKDIPPNVVAAGNPCRVMRLITQKK